MTLHLTIDRTAWMRHLDDTVEALPGLVPVVKGNGYGFGRTHLHTVAATLSPYVCVGSIHELNNLVPGIRPIVLTPAANVPRGLADDVVLTVGSTADVAALGDWNGQAMVKLRSSMRRYGASPSELHDVLAALAASGRSVFGFGIHLPLAGTDTERRAEIDEWVPHLSVDTPLWLSHLGEDAWAALRGDHPQRTFMQRVGTRLWHGSKSFLRLQADVAVVREVHAGDTAGYRASTVPSDGHLALISTGSANGVTSNDGLSPFHFARTRLALLEPTHMHTSMVHIPAGQPCPRPGDWVDVQRPLIQVAVDEFVWS